MQSRHAPPRHRVAAPRTATEISIITTIMMPTIYLVIFTVTVVIRGGTTIPHSRGLVGTDAIMDRTVTAATALERRAADNIADANAIAVGESQRGKVGRRHIDGFGRR